MTNKIIMDAPKGAMKNRQGIEQSQDCGCYHCLAIFPANTVAEWTDQSKTGLCPTCGVDSILPDSEFPISPELLQQAQSYWFESKK